MRISDIFIKLLFLSFVYDQVLADGNGVLYARSSASSLEWADHFCIKYNSHFHHLSTDKNSGTPYLLTDFTNDTGCFNSDAYKDQNVTNRIVAIARGNCTFTEKAQMAQDNGAAGILIVNNTLVFPAANQTSDYKKIHIIVFSITTADFGTVMREGSDVEVLLISPEMSGFDPCIIVIFLLAMSSITVGGFWAGVSKKVSVKSKPKKKKRKKTNDKEEDLQEGEEELDISIPTVIVFFVLVCTFLVLLYFFYDYLVYVVIALFCIAGTVGLFCCFHPIWNRIPWRSRLPKNKIPCLSQRPLYKDIILGMLCAAVAIFWGIQRNESYAWIIQDFLGLAFCINMMKTLQLPNLKICVVLMVLLFVYDIFFVFITPLFTSTGESVMVKVATGGDSGTSGEQLPMVFKVPRLNNSPLNVCNLPYSLLGFGDIIVPGLLVSYNHRFDVRVGSKRIYFISTVIAYGIGLIVTFAALYLMETGQPALLYLVPFTLITTFVIGCIRGEAKALWNGFTKREPKKDDDVKSGDIQAKEPSETISQTDNTSMCSSSSGGSENRTLLHK